MVRLVLFDMDGTLIRTGGAGIQAFERAFSTEFQVQRVTEAMNFAGRTDTSLVRECFLRHQIPVTSENFQRFLHTYALWLDYLLDKTDGSTCLGAWKFIRGLQCLPEPPVLGLLTGNTRLGAEIKLRFFRLWEVFQTGAFADDHEERDRLAWIARERGNALIGTALEEREVLVIGDTPRDVQCARFIGARMLAVSSGASSREELESHKPDWVVEDLQNVSVGRFCD